MKPMKQLKIQNLVIKPEVNTKSKILRFFFKIAQNLIGPKIDIKEG